MRYRLLMIDHPIIISNEKIIKGDYFYNTIDEEVYGPAWGHEALYDIDHKVIAQEKLGQIDWNGLEKEFGYIDIDKLSKEQCESKFSSASAIVNWKEGYQTCKELNDKLFSLSDVFTLLDTFTDEAPIYYIKKRFEKYVDNLLTFDIEIETEETKILDEVITWVNAPKITDGKIKILKKL